MEKDRYFLRAISLPWLRNHDLIELSSAGAYPCNLPGGSQDGQLTLHEIMCPGATPSRVVYYS